MQHSTSTTLKNIQNTLKTYNFEYSNLEIDKESSKYWASTFKMYNKTVIFRKAKITPTKEGQFVTLWKRSPQGPIIPYDTSNNFDLVIILVEEHKKSGLFIFTKDILTQQKVISDNHIGGKRALRLYPIWCKPTNKQAQKTQIWQLPYFIDKININTNNL